MSCSFPHKSVQNLFSVVLFFVDVWKTTHIVEKLLDEHFISNNEEAQCIFINEDQLNIKTI